MKNLKILKKNEKSFDHTKESAIAINHWKSFELKEKSTGLYGAHCWEHKKYIKNFWDEVSRMKLMKKIFWPLEDQQKFSTEMREYFG